MGEPEIDPKEGTAENDLKIKRGKGVGLQGVGGKKRAGKKRGGSQNRGGRDARRTPCNLIRERHGKIQLPDFCDGWEK